MKNYLLLLIAAGGITAFSSCALDPEYAEYKRQQKEKEKAEAEAMANNPYGAPQLPSNEANPYAVPEGSPQPDTLTPFQPLPPLPGGGGTNSNPAPVIGGPNMNIPGGGGSPLTLSQTITHEVVSGDTIWGLAKKYNVTEYEILTANNLSNNTIRIGQKLLIPQK